jgi:hypothetical protein
VESRLICYAAFAEENSVHSRELMWRVMFTYSVPCIIRWLWVLKGVSSSNHAAVTRDGSVATDKP